MKNVPAEKIESNRCSYTDLGEKCLQKFDGWDSVPASSAHYLCNLMSSGFQYVSSICVRCLLIIFWSILSVL